MSSQQLVTIIVIVMVANAGLIALALVTMRRRARADVARERSVGSGHDSISVSAMAAATPLAVATTTVATTGVDSVEEPAAADEMAEPSITDAGVVLVDPETGLETAAAWRRAVDEEVLRLVRYRRPATVMLVELDGFDRLTERLGGTAGSRVVIATARTIEAQSRGSDRCARLGPGRFGILLPETDEIRAINFVERVRAECDRWLEAGEVAMRLAIGWAILDPTQGATPALQEAERRLDGERRGRATSAA